MKKIASILIGMTLSGALCANAFGYNNTPQKVRIGLISRYNEASTIPLGDKSVNAGANSAGDFTLRGDSLKMVPANSFYVYLDEDFSSFSAAEARCGEIEAAGYDAAVVLNESGYGVCAAAGSRESANSAASKLGGRTVESTNKQMALKNGEDTLAVTYDTIKISSADNSVTSLGGRTYRGEIEFGRYTGGGITPVNVVDLDEYLYAVVASEMSSSWHGEALKAQAVAARTYAIYNTNKHNARGYSLCDTNDCQVYGGVEAEKESVTSAVKATSGEVICHNGEPVQAVFSASSGGFTCASEDAWSTYVPYLRAVDDSHEKSTEWTRTYTASEMESLLRAKGVNIGSVKNVAVTQTTSGGRCLELTFVGTKGTKTYSKEAVRTFFSSSRDGSLPSTMFTVNGKGSLGGTSENLGIFGLGKISFSDLGKMYGFSIAGAKNIEQSAVYVVGSGGKTESYGQSSGGVSVSALNETASTFVLSGKGNGHGVGMSQYGAKALAEDGYTYEEILKHYYTGVEID